MTNTTTKVIAACVLASLAPNVSSAKTKPLTLKQLEQTILRNEPLCRKATIGIATTFGGQGSGVIISKDGLILTAAHVVLRPGAEFKAVLANGRQVKAVTLLVNESTDSAVAKIIEKAPAQGWDFRPIRSKVDLKDGEWCTVIANGGGIQLNRPAPLRIGRVIANTKTPEKNVLISDCTVVSGDSGGPMFDIEGNVSAINSSIGADSALNNMHISSQTFISQWGDYLLKGKKLPSVAEVKKADLAERKKTGKSLSAIPEHMLPQMKTALKNKWPELNDVALDSLLNSATFNNGRLSIKPTPGTIAVFKKEGFDPNKYGLKLPKKTKKKSNPLPKKELEKAKENSAKKNSTSPKKQGANSSGITKELRPKLKKALKQQFPDLPEAALELMLNDSIYKSNQLTIQASDKTISEFKKLGLDPVKYGLKKASKAKAGKTPEQLIEGIYGKLQPAAIEILKKALVKNDKGQRVLRVNDAMKAELTKLGIDLVLKRKEHIITKKYGKVSPAAMKFLTAKLQRKGSGFNLAINQDDVKKLKAMGVIIKMTPKPKQTAAMVEKSLRKSFTKQYGNISEKAMKMLLKATKIDKRTGKPSVTLDATELKTLQEMGVKIKTTSHSYIAASQLHGDSAPDIISQIPHLANAIELHQNGKRIGLATAVKQDGLLVCKSSMLTGNDKVEISMSGVNLKAKVLARDTVSDLALLKVAAQLDVVPWTKEQTTLGRLLAVITDEQPMLATVSVNPRIIPTKTQGIGNGNKVVLGVATSSKPNKTTKGAHITKIFLNTPAQKAGLKKGDVITKVGAILIKDFSQLSKEIGKYKPGQKAIVTALRDGKPKLFTLNLQSAANSDMFSSDATNTAAQNLSAMGGPLSKRRVTFPECFSHDAIMWADDCGGPVYTIDGKLAGINIARFSRTTNYALTQATVEAALKRLFKKGGL